MTEMPLTTRPDFLLVLGDGEASSECASLSAREKRASVDNLRKERGKHATPGSPQRKKNAYVLVDYRWAFRWRLAATLIRNTACDSGARSGFGYVDNGDLGDCHPRKKPWRMERDLIIGSRAGPLP